MGTQPQLPPRRVELILYSSSGLNPKDEMGFRRVARECALQMLYQLDIGKLTPGEIQGSFWNMNEQPELVRKFAVQLFTGTVAQLEEIDRTIQKHAQNWRLKRMPAVDRNILRMAVYELLSAAKTPGTVVINEALEIARKFSTQDSAQFVNGVLDSVKDELIHRG
jgi:transcription antitermination protein NusB